jgi:aspartyl aminopeptidase|tara:strand:- start:452 stop:1762 length:1311 start_codon:yes stop_codon:yes gene_type:complete
MQKKALNQGLLKFLQQSPTPFHATANLAAILQDSGFSELDEGEAWKLKAGKYFVTRNQSSIIAFVIGKTDRTKTGIRMSGAHTDSPCLKVKPRPEIFSEGYMKLGVEVYGGALLNPWYDRDLSLAGRVTYQAKNKQIHNLLINFNQPMAVIPSLAIHLDRDANKKREINAQTDIPPILMLSGKSQTLDALLKKQIKKENPKSNLQKVLGHELSFYDTNPASIIGMKEEFIAGARLDNLLSCYVGIQALLSADPGVTSLAICSDHEEVGSASATGAEGPFLKAVLKRMIPDTEDRLRAIAKSLLISTDNAHGIHPNYPDKHDANHGPILNKGPVIKVNANQRYATNSETEGYFSLLCENSDVPFRKYVTRTDMACGSTIGPITAKEIGIRTLDVGVPTFAMHSIRETAGVDDTFHLYRALSAFFTDTGHLRRRINSS